METGTNFHVEPSTGRVYVESVAGHSGNMTLHAKATDPHGLYDITTVVVGRTGKMLRFTHVMLSTLTAQLTLFVTHQMTLTLDDS